MAGAYLGVTRGEFRAFRGVARGTRAPGPRRGTRPKAVFLLRWQPRPPGYPTLVDAASRRGFSSDR